MSLPGVEAASPRLGGRCSNRFATKQDEYIFYIIISYFYNSFTKTKNLIKVAQVSREAKNNNKRIKKNKFYSISKHHSVSFGKKYFHIIQLK